MVEKDCFYHANRLAELIKIKTVSSSALCAEEFERFRVALKETFPKVFQNAVVENFDGSLLVRIKGNSDKAPIMLMNHYDVVEAGDGWKYPPYSGTIAAGKLWGRGAIDTKGGLYSMFEAVEELLESGFEFDRDVYLETSSNEETTGDGARKISKELERRGLKFQFVLDEGGMIVEEPLAGTYGDFALIGVGEKATAMVKFIAKSSGGHSSTPEKNSPLVRIAKFMVEVEDKKLFKAKLSKTVRTMFKRISKKMNSPLKIVLRNPLLFAPAIKFAMPRVSNTAAAMLKTTVAFTMAKASDGDNVIPDEAYVVANIRYSHHQGSEESLAILKKLAYKHDLIVEVVDGGETSPVCSYKSAEFKFVEKIVEEVFPSALVSPYVMTGASDCRFMSVLSENCLRFSPFKVTNEQLASIHGKDENVDVESLSSAVEFYKKILKEEFYESEKQQRNKHQR